jgi:hypothetical protein
MSAEIVELGPHNRMTAKEALAITMRENPEEVLIIFVDSDGDLGIRSSAMERKDALWSLEIAKNVILNGVSDD